MQRNRGQEFSRKDQMKTKQPKCVLAIQAPRYRGGKFQTILSPVLRLFDPSSVCVHVTEDETLPWNVPPDKDQQGGSIPRYQDNKNELSTPALAVMLFLQERGTTSAQDVQKHFKRYPWKVHHKIELQNKRSPAVKIGQQEFYSLSREYPLWSVCPVYAGFEHLRLNLFVTKFSEMVEFYRLVTDSEMESTKPDFCLFPMCSEEEFQVMLCLKRCRQLRPFSLTRAYLNFKVRNIVTLKNLLRGELQQIAHKKYLIRDPDGNPVVLEDMNTASVNSVEYKHEVFSRVSDVSCDVTSVKSVCGSHDSGRYSDSDQCASELELKKLKKVVHFRETEYEKMWIYKKEPIKSQKDNSSKYSDSVSEPESDTTLRDCDLSYEDYYDESSKRCYPGMVIAHAQLVENHQQQYCQGELHIKTISDPLYKGYQTRGKPPIVTVTDCSGNVHNCIERVIHPYENWVNQGGSFGFSQGQGESLDSMDKFSFERQEFSSQIMISDSPTAGPETSGGEFCASRRHYENQNCDLDIGQVTPACRSRDDRGSCPEAGEGRCISGGLIVPPGHWGWDDCESVEEMRLREEVNKKRLVKPVYI